MREGLLCPRCKGLDFEEYDSGPDGYEDDIAYNSYQCKRCSLWYSDWTEKWYAGIDNWRDETEENEWIVGSMKK